MNTAKGGTIKAKKIMSFDSTWSIKRFQSFQSTKDVVIASPELSSTNKINDNWCIELCTNNFDKNDEGYLSIHLKLISCKVKEIEVKFYFNIMQADGSLGRHERHLIAKFQKNSSHGFENFINKEDLFSRKNKYITNGALDIYCRIEFLPPAAGFSNGQKHSDAVAVNGHQSLSNDLKVLLQNSTGTDVTIVVDSKKIFAHKAILLARSPYFSSIFNDHSDAQSNHSDSSAPKRRKFSTNCLELNNISLEIANKMIEFIYTDDTSNIAPHTQELFMVADEYQIHSLKSACEKQMGENLTLDNAPATLIFAHNHKSPILKKVISKFIFKNFKDIVKTPGYIDLKTEHPSLLGEILEGNLC